MTEAAADTQSVVVERDLPFPPERVWRALTERHLIAEWLMQNDFAPHAGQDFEFSADWGRVNGRVLEVEQRVRLSYTWVSSGLDSVVTWTLTPSGTGTRLRMEQQGFRRDQMQAFHGARAGWPRFLDALEQAVARAD